MTLSRFEPIKRVRDALAATAALLALLVLASASLSAQSTTRDDQLRELFGDLPREARVEITAPGIRTVRGRVTALGDRELEVSDAGVIQPVRFRDIETVAVESNRVVLGAGIGAGLGVTGGWLIGLMVNSFGCTTADACNRSGVRGARRGAVTGAIVGGVGGVLMGRAWLHWKTVFP